MIRQGRPKLVAGGKLQIGWTRRADSQHSWRGSEPQLNFQRSSVESSNVALRNLRAKDAGEAERVRAPVICVMFVEQLRKRVRIRFFVMIVSVADAQCVLI
jgi:hypothetical protein